VPHFAREGDTLRHEWGTASRPFYCETRFDRRPLSIQERTWLTSTSRIMSWLRPHFGETNAVRADAPPNPIARGLRRKELAQALRDQRGLLVMDQVAAPGDDFNAGVWVGSKKAGLVLRAEGREDLSAKYDDRDRH